VPKRRSRRLLLVGLLVAAFLGGAGTAAGLVIFGKPPPPDPRALALALAELSASATPTETPHTGELRSLLLAPPAGSRLFARPFSADGTLTLAQIADWFNTSTDALAHDTDITAGAIAQFVTSDSMSVSIVLLSFPRPQTAHQWASVRRDRDYIGNTLTDDSPVPGYPESGLSTPSSPTSTATSACTPMSRRTTSP
jgi:hypothetical protein